MTGEMIFLDDLFRATKGIELPQGLRGQVRALSDGEIKERRRYAILYGQKAIEDIEDESSDAYRLTIAPLMKEKQKAPLLDVIMQVRSLELLRDASAFHPHVMIPMPDEVTDDQEREILAQRATQEQELKETRTKFVASRMKAVRQKHSRLTVNKLRQMAKTAVVAVYEQAAGIDAMQWYTVYAGVSVWRDDTWQRLYQSPDAVRDSPEVVVMRLFSQVGDVNVIDPWEIAKNV